jgi:hypothetical protein
MAANPPPQPPDRAPTGAHWQPQGAGGLRAGGLYVPASTATAGEVPTAARSLLGLDALAAAKRAAAKGAAARADGDGADDGDAAGGAGSREGFAVPPPLPPQARAGPQYRAPRAETPSHPGGVNSDALAAIRDRARQAGACIRWHARARGARHSRQLVRLC